MNTGSLLLLSGGIRFQEPKTYRFRAGTSAPRSPFLQVKSVNPQPVRPKLDAGNRGTDPDRPGGRASKRARVCLWLVACLFLLTTMACGLGAQRIQHRREMFRLGQQLKQREVELRRTALAGQVTRASFALHVAQERQQTEVRLAAAARAKPKSTTRG